MASRKEQKEQAREQRLAKERAAKEAAARQQRLMIFGGIAALAVVIVVVIIVISSGGGGGGASAKPSTNVRSKTNVANVSRVSTLLAGIPQTPGTMPELGNPKAKVTITEFGDFECSVCDELALPSGVTSPGLVADGQGGSGTGILDSVIKDYVATGKAKLVFKSLETVTGAWSNAVWLRQQSAANAAALQGKGWEYVELIYAEQGKEQVNWATPAVLESIAKQIPGLDYDKWYHDWKNDPAVSSDIAAQNTEGTELAVNEETLQGAPASQRGASTPTIWVKGPNNQETFVGLPQGGAAAVGKAVNAAS